MLLSRLLRRKRFLLCQMEREALKSMRGRDLDRGRECGYELTKFLSGNGDYRKNFIRNQRLINVKNQLTLIITGSLNTTFSNSLNPVIC